MGCKKKGRKGGLLALLFVVVMALFVPAIVPAQSTNPAPQVDWNVVIVGLVGVLTPILTPFCVWLIRYALASNKIPRIAWPIVALVLGWVGSWLAGAHAGIPLWAPPLLGMAAVFVREVVNTISEHGLNG